MADIKLDSRLIALTDKNSFIAEQYRNLRAKILLATEDSSKKTILVTSAVPGEGKSLTSINLAITIAQGIQEKVLLVDADLRHPSLHTLLGIKPEKGLSDYLREEIDLESIILSTPADKLSLLPVGNPAPNPSELLESQKMRDLIKALKRRYPDRFIIFDSPPTIPTADPIILAKMIDWIIFVILAGKTPRETISRALASYEPKNILGIILNRLEILPAEYSYGYKHKHYYTPTTKPATPTTHKSTGTTL